MRTHQPWARQLDAAIDAHVERAVQVRRHLHAHPELSGQEFQTTAYLAKLLREAGYQVRLGPDKRGLIADPPAPESDDDPLRIALRADIDALPIQDAKCVGYRSTVPGVMHACGHDAHTAAVLAAALGLYVASTNDALPWPVHWRCVFQPAEETAVGALEMIEAGALAGISAILGLHTDPTHAVGGIGLRSGVLTADCHEMSILLTGEGGHASRPHHTRDPIAAVCQLVNLIYQAVPRAVDAQQPLVVTFGQITGGQAHNAIPDQVLLRGTIRAIDAQTADRAKKLIIDICRGVAIATRLTVEPNFKGGPPAVDNDPQLIAILRRCAVELLGPAGVYPIPRTSMGGEDFANYQHHVPGAMFRLGCAPPELAATGSPPLHTNDFDIDERAIAIGARLMARAAVAWSAPAELKQNLPDIDDGAES